VRFEGKVALVSGAARGIGQACARRLAAEGAKVIVTDQHDCDETIGMVRASGGTVVYQSLDVRRRTDWNEAVAAGLDEFGHIDWLANVAGVINSLSEDSIVGLTDDAWDFVVGTNLRGTWLGMQAVIPHMQRNGGGRIVNISSASALRGLMNSASYAASKAGVIGLTQQAAQAYAKDNILINAICPGTIDTPIFGQSVPDEFKAGLAQFHLIKRLGHPDEVAGKLAYFVSEDGSFSTGQTESVDGGWSINGHTT
jgi:NAD(P)-dependent dehydrogenase (short-subunit alcohol dehydrogenase family)